uniref:UPF0561 protein C2orf68 homolog n=1 Tax=Geotrypetes seraphini TaxID=260995 RepID=A0A6P8RJ16_GEOSA|nr:UPF0561 protein C2orf68 homolog [Geotrypetes seraphini]
MNEKLPGKLRVTLQSFSPMGGEEVPELPGRVDPEAGPRLDMTHGFVHYIRRNQIARDDYDKEVKQAKEKQKKRHTPVPSRPKKPDLQVYHPRHRGGGGGDLAPGLEYEESSESSCSADPEPPESELFCLEYKTDSGEITSVILHKEDPDEVTEKNLLKEPVQSINEEDAQTANPGRNSKEADAALRTHFGT